MTGPYASSQITAANVVAELRNRFPTLRARIDEVCDDGAHVVFGWAVNAGFFAPALDRHEISDADVAAMFGFVEEMATSSDYEVRNVVEVTICEWLGDDADRLDRARSLMGPNTLNLSRQIEHYLGREWPGGAPPDA